MSGKHVLSAAVGAAVYDIAREIVVDEAESLILKALRAFWAWLQNFFGNGGQQNQPAWA